MTKGRHNQVSPLAAGSDEYTPSSEPAFLAVGRVLRPHGLKGEVKVEIHTDFPERFALYKRLYLGADYTPYTLQFHRFHQQKVLLKLEGIEDRTAAESLREQWVWVALQDAVPLQEGEYYLHQMMHLRVITVDGEDLGKVTEIIETGANPVYVVQGQSGQVLLPDTDEVIVEVDMPAKKMTVRLIEGLR